MRLSAARVLHGYTGPQVWSHSTANKTKQQTSDTKARQLGVNHILICTIQTVYYSHAAGQPHT